MVSLAAPEAVEYLKTIRGSASCRTRWTWNPDRQPPLSYDTEFDLRDGQCTAAALPCPIQELALKSRIHDGELTVQSLTGKLGPSGLNVKLEVDAPKPDPKSPMVLMSAIDLEDRLRRLEITVSDLTVGPELFDRLPAKFAETRAIFSPTGVADITFEQKRENGKIHKKAVLRPKNMAGNYRGFPYPIDRIRGTIEATLEDDVAHRYEVDLVGEANGKPVTLKGHVVGGADREIDLVLTGSDIVLDKQLIDALPDEYPKFVRRLHPTATGDFTAKIRHNARIRRDHGPEAFDNEFDISIRSGSLLYEDFPYQLRNLAGKLFIRTVPEAPSYVTSESSGARAASSPDLGVVEFRDFTATGSNGCKLKIKGGKRPAPNGAVLVLDVDGDSVPLDGQLGRAIAKLRIENSWATFNPSGQMNCRIHVEVHDHGSPPGQPSPAFDPNRDLVLGLSFNGPSLRPTFFSYLLTDAAGQVSFAEGRVDLRNFSARHGRTSIELPAAKVLLPPTGGFWADLYDLKINPVICDREFLAALPRGLRSACLGLEPQGAIAFHAKRLVIDDQPKGPPPARFANGLARVSGNSPIGPKRGSLPTIYWDGTIAFRDSTMKTGVTWEGVTGQFSTRGLYLGDRLGRVVGNLAVDRGRVLKQPVEAAFRSI